MTHAAKDSHSKTYAVRLGERGRIVLPARLRREADLHEGDELVVSLDGDGLRLVSRRERARAGRGAFAYLAPGRSIVDEFLDERRLEAASEIADSSRSGPDPTRRRA